MKICPHCNAELNDSLSFCTKCGAKLPVVSSVQESGAENLHLDMRCPSCGINFDNNSVFCNQCGTKLEPIEEQTPIFLYNQCPGCKKKFEDDSIYCNMCGIKLVKVYDKPDYNDATVQYCKSCNIEYKDDSIFCTECGQKLEQVPKSSVQTSNTPLLEKTRDKNSDQDSYVLHCKVCGCSVKENQERCGRCNTFLYDSNVVKIKL